MNVRGGKSSWAQKEIDPQQVARPRGRSVGRMDGRHPVQDSRILENQRVERIAESQSLKGLAFKIVDGGLRTHDVVTMHKVQGQKIGPVLMNSLGCREPRPFRRGNDSDLMNAHLPRLSPLW